MAVYGGREGRFSLHIFNALNQVYLLLEVPLVLAILFFFFPSVTRLIKFICLNFVFHLLTLQYEIILNKHICES